MTKIAIEAAKAAAMFNGQDIHDVIVKVEDAESGRTMWTSLYYVDEAGQRVAFVEYGENEEEGQKVVYDVSGRELVRRYQMDENTDMETAGFIRVELY